MLPKHSRLTAREVENVLTGGRFLRSGTIHMRHLAGPNALKLSVVVPKSTARLAVKRNAIRRAAYRALLGMPPFPASGMVVLFVRQVPVAPMQAALKKEFEVLYKNLS